MPQKPAFSWHCRRMGGTDQVTLITLAELRHLRELDPKLWGALSCPATGIEFDQRTLALLDTDGDGRIRMPEVLAATEWLCAHLKDTADITGQPLTMPLAALDSSTESGTRLLATARSVLTSVGRPEDEELTQTDVIQAMDGAANQSFNGDGILPPVPELDDEVRRFVETGLAVVGGVEDASGAAGLDIALSNALVKELERWLNWRQTVVAAAPHPVPDTEAAWALMEEIRPKVDDFFLRCSLADFAPQVVAPLNAEERLAAAIDPTERPDIDETLLESLPLARVAPDATLPLKQGLNPVWSERVQRFAELVAPLLPSNALSAQDWKRVKEMLAPYGAALDQRPAVETYEEGAFAPPADPAAALDALGEEGVRQLLAPEVYERFQSLCAQDLSSASAITDIAELERLVLYYLHLHHLLMNFVSFHDFYNLSNSVTFRAGTLYMDGRSCKLCVPVADIESHCKLASMSQMCLLYCECTRRSDEDGSGVKRTIMAALTAGDNAVLVEGRNGVFVDNTGEDWDATLVRIVHNPISLRQAIWAPYKRAGQLLGEQIAKFATSKNAVAIDSVKSAASTAIAPKPAAQPFDMGKNVGIFAAVGIALGAIGTAVGSIAQALFSLSWWQFPLLLLGIFLIVSGPSVLLAWLKFRKRALGPVLEASGWAVNTQLPINLKMGNALTATAVPPSNIERQPLLDPFRDEKGGHGCLWLCLLLTLVLALAFWLWQQDKLDLSRLGLNLPKFEQVFHKADTPEGAKGPVALDPAAKVKQSPPVKVAPPKPAPPPAPPKPEPPKEDAPPAAP